jgi:hypothetical protein
LKCRKQCAEQNRPRHGIFEHAPQSIFGGLTDALLASTIEARQGNAERGGNDHVNDDGDDGGPSSSRSEQGHQQRNAHETRVGKRAHQGTKSAIVPTDALVHGDGQHKGHHDQGTKQVHEKCARI